MENRAGIAAAAERNKEPILNVLRQVLPASIPASRAGGRSGDESSGRRPLVLELASGTGQHAVHVCHALPHLDWQPSDPDPAALGSISAHRDAAGLDNLLPPLELDVTRLPWPMASADAVFCANMIHIAPWEAAIGLADGAASLLQSGGLAVLYGPYRRDGRHTAPSNAAFDDSLRARDLRWGIRDLEAVADLFARRGFIAPQVLEMPANNLILVFRRPSDAREAANLQEGRQGRQS